MLEPKEEVRYILVRQTALGVAQVNYTRFADDDVYIVSEEYIRIIEFAPPMAWLEAWADLLAQGFVELSQSRKAGLIPFDWEPSDDFE